MPLQAMPLHRRLQSRSHGHLQASFELTQNLPFRLPWAPLLINGLLLILTGCDETPPTPTPLPGNQPNSMTGVTGTLNTPFITPPVSQPRYGSRQECPFADDEPVIGIVVNGTPLAYVCKAMSRMTTHVVTDQLDGQSFAVTYCDQTNCARVFKSTDSETPVDVRTGGFVSGSMHLMVSGKMYSQPDKSIPLADLDFERSTLAEWMVLHPDSRIFWDSGTSD